MTVTRAAHSATVLPDGRVLLAGGCIETSCEGVTAQTELWDPASESSVPGPAMTEERVGHTALALRDGRVLILGGFGDAAVTASTEIYDPAAGTFSKGPDMTVPRAGALAFVLADGTVFVVGGFDGRAAVATTEILDLAAGASQPAAPMAASRGGFAGAVLADGRILVTGGSSGGSGAEVRATAEIYDPATQTWTSTGDMTIRRHKHAAAALADGRVLVVGGSDERDGHGVYATAEIYDPETGSFAATSEMASPRYKVIDSVVRLADGRVLVAGGAPQPEVFDPASGTFASVPGDGGAGFSFATANLLPDGSVVIAGGYDTTITLTDQVLRYEP